MRIEPCPFNHTNEPCDGLTGECEAAIQPWTGEWAVVCTWCAAWGPTAKTEEDAVTLWNRRSR